MSPVVGAILLCAQSLPAMAADSPSSGYSINAEHQLREQVEAKRDRLSGADQITPTAQTGSAEVLDAPVATDDAPTQVQQP
ncbi:hypothetical protein [Pseudomonas sp. PB3P13]